MRTLPKLVGLQGPKQVGKDTAATALVEEYGYVRLSFADGVREMALAIDPYVVLDVENDDGEVYLTVHRRLSEVVETLGWDEAKRYPDVRRLLQRVGTEGARETFGADAWVGRLSADWAEAGFPPAVVTDVRFPNEAEWIASEGGVVVRIRRPGFEGGGHVSETWDAEEWPLVENDSSIEDLRWRFLTTLREETW